MEKRKISRRTIVKIQVTAFLLSIFLIGFGLGFLVGRLTAPKPTKETIEETSTVPAEYTFNVTNGYIFTTTPAAIACETPTEETTEEVIEEKTFYYNVPLTKETQDYIFERCKADNVPVPLVIALIDKESDFTADVVSKTHDYGYMQINKCNHEWLEDTYGINDFLDPQNNIYCGVKILSYFLDKYDDYDKVLMCYNFGEGRAIELWADGVTSSEYSRSVVELMEEYENGTGNETR